MEASGCALGLTQIKDLSGIPRTDTTLDRQIEALLPGVKAMVASRCRIVFDPAEFTEYYSGKNTPVLFLRQLPVLSVLEVATNKTGAWGQGPGDWTVLDNGTDWAVESQWGALRRVPSNSGSVWLAPARTDWPMQLPPLVTPITDPTGNVRVTYQAGHDFSDPRNADLALAVALLVNKVRRSIKQGGSVQSWSYSEFSTTLAASELFSADIQLLLSRYTVPVI